LFESIANYVFTKPKTDLLKCKTVNQNKAA